MVINVGSPDYILHGATSLYFAVHAGDYKTAKSLLKNNAADVNQQTKDGISPIYVAVQKKNTALCELLLSYNANPNNSDSKGFTPLHLAVEKGNIKIAKMLLQHQADANIGTKSNITPIFLAVKNGSVRMCLLLLNYKANVRVWDDKRNSILHLAVVPNHYQLVELVLKNIADFDKKTKEDIAPTYKATKTDQQEICSLLLAYGADPNVSDQNGRTSLHLAATYNQYESAESILKYGGYVNKRTLVGVSAIYLAAKYADRKMVELLLRFGADSNCVDSEGTSPLHLVVSRRMYKTAELLLQNKARVNQVNKDGVTALYVACSLGHKALCELLLRHGSDPNISDKNRNSPLYVLMRGPEAEVPVMNENLWKERINCLLYSFKPIQRVKDLQIIELLLKWNACPNQMNKNGFTPLHVGILKGCTNLVHLLLSYNADPTYHEEDKKSALYFARHRDLSLFEIMLQNCTRLQDELTNFFKNGRERSHCVYDQVLRTHLTKLDIVDQVVRESCRLNVVDDFKEKCLAELVAMKTDYITEDVMPVSCFDLLTYTVVELSKCLPKESLGDILEKRNWTKKYPIYKDLIKWKLKKTVMRMKEIDGIEATLCNVFEQFSNNTLPRLCCNKIIGYFTDEEIKKSACLLKPDLYYWSE